MTARVALVTGGTGGIGTAICRRLADLGYQVVAGYFSGNNHEKARKWKTEQAEAGYEIDISYADLKDPDCCLRSYLDIKETKGNIDVLINNAGIAHRSAFANTQRGL